MDLKLLVFVVAVAAAEVTGLPDDDQALDFNHGNQTFSKTRQTSRSGNEAESSITTATILSPSYPNRYPKRSVQEWHFTVTGRVELFCSVFNLRPRKGKVCRDYLQIEYEEANVVRRKRYCADELNGVTTVYNTNRLDLTFKSLKNKNNLYIGFNCTMSPCSLCSCGVNIPELTDRNNKIVGGKELKNKIPRWLALIVLSESFERVCGGSVIAPRYILTAAHCTESFRPGDLLVRLGERCLSNPPRERREYNVREIIEHGAYNQVTRWNNDIALLRLRGNIDFANTPFRPICLPVTATNPIRDQDDVRAAILGWGLLEEGGELPDCLQYAWVPTMSNTRCEELYPRDAITQNMICAGYEAGGIDSCTRDSGGPMVAIVTSASGSRYAVQIGVVSWGRGCAQPNQPGVYTRVTEYINWISTNTDDSATCNLG